MSDGSYETRGDIASDASRDIGNAGEGAMPTSYSDMGDSAKWATFLAPSAAAPGGFNFQGAAFDGRYLYFAPISTSQISRYDTKARFDATSSWSVFDARSLAATTGGFVGAVFDGRFVYFVPFSGLQAVRFDSQGTFTNTTDWQNFDMSSLSAAAGGYFGGAFDGRYVYFCPYRHPSTGAYQGFTIRYDTQADFRQSSAWTPFNMTTVSPDLVGFAGLGWDGRFVYYVPFAGGGGHVTARFDSRLPFDSATAWSTFDTGTLDAGAHGFQGAAFDGRYLYLVPWGNGSGKVLARVDTTAAFQQSASWSTFDTSLVNSQAMGFVGAGFDGRYIYFPPYGTGTSGFVVRYDTTSDLRTSSSWSTFDVSKLSAAAGGFGGAAFDGRYLYMIPETTSTVARFDAKFPPSLPQILGSFM